MNALARLPIGADAVLLSGTKIVMRQPRLTGYTKDERPYTVTARTAAKDLANPDVLESLPDVPLYRTDVHGALEFTTDGVDLYVMEH